MARTSKARRIVLGVAILIAGAFLAKLVYDKIPAAMALDRIKLPPGFRIEMVADVPNARGMTWGDQGTLFVGSREGRVFALTLPASGAATVREVARGLNAPIGVAFRDGTLYVSAVSRILRLPAIESRLDAPPEAEALPLSLPPEGWHGAKYLAFGPDGKLYVPQGMPCNVCERDPDRHGTIARVDPEGGGWEVVARGVRNSVGFDWHPATGELYFTDNGRDMMGDDLPPDELNRLRQPGLHFGFPYCHAGDLPDPEFGAKRRCDEFEPPAHRFGAHVAPLGLAFYTGAQFPPEYRHAIFVAEHGSWNRSSKVGYRVSVLFLDDQGRVRDYRPFAEGFLDGGTVRGRPADVIVAPDGALLVSDDHAGAIYRISYRP
jgi:glucose/arabinose dehydrogenase